MAFSDADSDSWPSTWDGFAELSQYAATKWAKAPSLRLLPLLEEHVTMVTEISQKWKLNVVETHPSCVFFRRHGVPLRGTIGYHCTNWKSIQKVFEPGPWMGRLAIGFSSTRNKRGVPAVGVYYASRMSGALQYLHGTRSLQGLGVIVVIQVQTEGTILSSIDNRCMGPNSANHDIVGLIMLRSLSGGDVSCWKPGMIHPLRDHRNRAWLPPDYVQYSYDSCGCDRDGKLVGLRDCSTDIFGVKEHAGWTWPEEEEEVEEYEMQQIQLAPGSAELIEQLLKESECFATPSTPSTQQLSGLSSLELHHQERRTVDWWRKHQDEFSGWAPLPTDQWYCRTKSDRVCIWDFVKRSTFWPPPESRPPLPVAPKVSQSITVPIVDATAMDTTTVPAVEVQIISATEPAEDVPMVDTTARNTTSVPASPEQPPTPAATELPDMMRHIDDFIQNRGTVSLLTTFSPRLRTVLEDRKNLLPVDDFARTLKRLTEAGFESSVCSHLFDDSSHAQRVIVKPGDPGTCRKLVGDVFYATQAICRLQTKKRAAAFTLPSTVTSPQLVPSIVPQSLHLPVIGTVVDTAPAQPSGG